MKHRILCALAMALIIIIIGLHQNGVALFEYNGEKAEIVLEKVGE